MVSLSQIAALGIVAGAGFIAYQALSKGGPEEPVPVLDRPNLIPPRAASQMPAAPIFNFAAPDWSAPEPVRFDTAPAPSAPVVSKKASASPSRSSGSDSLSGGYSVDSSGSGNMTPLSNFSTNSGPAYVPAPSSNYSPAPSLNYSPANFSPVSSGASPALDRLKFVSVATKKEAAKGGYE